MKLEDLGLGTTGQKPGALTGDQILELILEAEEHDYPWMLTIAKPLGGGKADTICIPSAGTSMSKWAEVVAAAAAAGLLASGVPPGPKIVS